MCLSHPAWRGPKEQGGSRSIAQVWLLARLNRNFEKEEREEKQGSRGERAEAMSGRAMKSARIFVAWGGKEGDEVYYEAFENLIRRHTVERLYNRPDQI